MAGERIERDRGHVKAATPLAFLGLLGVWRRLAKSDVATAGLVIYGWGCVAMMSAAEGSNMPGPFLHYTGLWNQGFAKSNVVATSTGILLFSVAILRSARLAAPAW